jgi:hypothetical protein
MFATALFMMPVMAGGKRQFPVDTPMAFILTSMAAIWIGTFVFVRRASRRYEREQIAAGRWDENGPLHPTSRKPWEVVSRMKLGLRLRDRSTESTTPDE